MEHWRAVSLRPGGPAHRGLMPGTPFTRRVWAPPIHAHESAKLTRRQDACAPRGLRSQGSALPGVCAPRGPREGSRLEDDFAFARSHRESAMLIEAVPSALGGAPDLGWVVGVARLGGDDFGRFE